MAQTNTSAKRYRIQCDGAEATIEGFQLQESPYQFERFPRKELNFTVTAIEGDPLPTNTRLQYGKTVTLELQLSNGIWHQVFTGQILSYVPSDGRQGRGEGNSIRSMAMAAIDRLAYPNYPTYPFDASAVSLGSAQPVNSVLERILRYTLQDDTATIVEYGDPFNLAIATSRAYDPQKLVGTHDFIHQFLWANPTIADSVRILTSDRLGQIQFGVISTMPDTFLFDGNANTLLQFNYNTADREKMPGEIVINGSYDYTLRSTGIVGEPKVTYGRLVLPAQPKLIQENPPVYETTREYSNLPLFESRTTVEILPFEIRTTIKTREPWGLIYTKHPDDIAEDAGNIITFDNRTRTLLRPSDESVESKMFDASGRLIELRLEETGLRVRVDPNDTSGSSRVTIRRVTTKYEYQLNGIIKKITQVSEQARGIADQEAFDEITSQNYTQARTSLDDLVTTEIDTQLWEPFADGSDRYIFDRTIQRPYGENEQIHREGDPESVPPQTEYYQGQYERLTRNVSCSYLIASSGTPNYKKDIDYGDTLINRQNCENSARIEARFIAGQYEARDIEMELTDSVIQNLWPSDRLFSPYMKVQDDRDGRAKIYLMDSINIRGDRLDCSLTCYALHLGDYNTAQATNQPIAAIAPTIRQTTTGAIRVTGDGRLRVVN